MAAIVHERDHRAALGLAAGVAVAAHALVLGGWPGYAVQVPPGRPMSVAALEVRQIAAAAPVVASVSPSPANGTPSPSTSSPPAPTPSSRREASAAPAPPQTMQSAAARAEHMGAAATRSVPAAAGAEPYTEVADRPVVAGPGSTEAWAAVPTYRTAAPTSVTLDYEVQRGEAVGAARLAWHVDASGHYELELRGLGEAATRRPANPALAALTPHWTSRGALDANGIAPERFAVSRRGRERHAANFQREAGIVSFAGPTRTWPLLPGAQDRLSWMLQLAAVLQADPALAAEGRQISMMVVGAHGDAGVWTFTVLGAATAVAGPDGATTAAWHLQREARHAHDPQVQVWLAPALQHLPVRLRLTLARSGESTEFRLRAFQAP